MARVRGIGSVPFTCLDGVSTSDPGNGDVDGQVKSVEVVYGVGVVLRLGSG